MEERAPLFSGAASDVFAALVMPVWVVDAPVVGSDAAPAAVAPLVSVPSPDIEESDAASGVLLCGVEPPPQWSAPRAKTLDSSRCFLLKSMIVLSVFGVSPIVGSFVAVMRRSAWPLMPMRPHHFLATSGQRACNALATNACEPQAMAVPFAVGSGALLHGGQLPPRAGHIALTASGGGARRALRERAFFGHSEARYRVAEGVALGEVFLQR
jgi:hypothetical protein